MVYLWLIFTPESAKFTVQTLNDFKSIVSLVKTHSVTQWCMAEEEMDNIDISKVEATQDLKGSLLPINPAHATQ